MQPPNREQGPRVSDRAVRRWRRAEAVGPALAARTETLGGEEERGGRGDMYFPNKDIVLHHCLETQLHCLKNTNILFKKTY